MKALIIEDELMAQKNLIRILSENFPDIQVIGTCSSVKSSIEWLALNNPDIIFMDVELSDGKSFEIFKQIQIRAQVIMTTAYDNYAIKAFEAGSVDYILKPVDLSALQRAIDRCRKKLESSASIDIQKLMAALNPAAVAADHYKARLLVKFNDRIVPINISDIAYFFSEDKENQVVTKEGLSYITDASLDTIAADLDPSKFFKISRSCIFAKDNIESITKLLGGRLRLSAKYGLKKGKEPDLTVSRSRTDEFLKWMED